jgi:hypothetical protein
MLNGNHLLVLAAVWLSALACSSAGNDAGTDTGLDLASDQAQLDIEVEAVCEPACEGKTCGDDGCDGACGKCDEHYQCEVGACVYQPLCGDGTCDPVQDENCKSCAEDCECIAPTLCLDAACCEPTCENRQCGSDGCPIPRKSPTVVPC